MAKIPDKLRERFKKHMQNYKALLLNAQIKDVNEADTVVIIREMLCDLFGYDKFSEITTEYSIKSTYCDLAILLENHTNPEFLIEVKAIGVNLKDTHLTQTINYGANNGVPWVILTNGLIWRVYHIRDRIPVEYNLVIELDFETLSLKKDADIEKLYSICKEGIPKGAREEYLSKTKCLNKHTIGAILQSNDTVNSIRKILSKPPYGIKVSNDEILEMLRTEILKRDAMEGEDAKKAERTIKKIQNLEQKKQDNAKDIKMVVMPSSGESTESNLSVAVKEK